MQSSGSPDPLGPFLAPVMEPSNVDRYLVRRSVLDALRNALPLFKGVFLDVGCGIMPYKSLITKAPAAVTKYIGMDIVTDIYKADVDLRWDGCTIPLPDASVDSAMATEVLEHCPDPARVLSEIRRVLKPGGFFFFTVPYIWPLHDVPYDFYRYTPFALEKLLAEAGFESVGIHSHTGWNGSLAHVLGLWLKRAPLAPAVRENMFKQFWPFYKMLVDSDNAPDSHLREGHLSAGWSGTARVPGKKAAAADESAFRQGVEGLCIANFHVDVYSETFIADHIDHLCDKPLVLWGNPPAVVNLREGGNILTAQEMEALRAAKNPQEQSVVALPAVARILAERKIRVVLAEYGPIGVALAPVCEKMGIPLVVHFHGYDASLHSWFANGGAFYRHLFKVATRIVVVSNAMRDRLLAEGAPAEKLVLSPYGVDVDEYAPASPGENPPTFLSVGRFVEKKRPDLTIRAFAEMASSAPDATLCMIGSGDLLPKCRKLAEELGVADRVSFAGVQSRDMVHAYMSRARAFVQHSVVAANGDSEGLPVGILEAGSMGLPVVSTVHAGIPDAVRSGTDGFLVPEGDVSGMAQAMKRLALEPILAAEMGASFRKRVEENYTRSICFVRLASILRDAAAGR